MPHHDHHPEHGHHGHGERGQHGNPKDLEHFVAKLEDPERLEWQKPDEVLDALKLGPDSVVGEIGAGSGFFTLRLARRVRHVYAVDAEPQLLGVLRDRLQQAAVRNVTPVLGMPERSLLPAGACDLALMVDTLHHLPDRAAYLRELAAALRPGGRIAVVDWHRRELPVGPAMEHKVAREDALLAGEQAGLALVDEATFLPYQYLLVLRART
ncbi:MAG TPA: class I SAM-dependent methyltransferase [Myxococcaceae bacterium]|nr:class I SAM-dependent methyltransferase [Myxococcaceae bacterium]